MLKATSHAKIKRTNTVRACSWRCWFFFIFIRRQPYMK